METIYCHLLLSEPLTSDFQSDFPHLDLVRHILNGDSYKVLADQRVQPMLASKLDTTSKESLVSSLTATLSDDSDLLLLAATALLQCFIQNNYTGPTVPLSTPLSDTENTALIQLLSCLGQPAYELCDDPVYLAASLAILDKLCGGESLFLTSDNAVNLDNLTPHKATALWIRSRALMAQMSLIPEPTGVQPIVCATSLDVALPKCITEGVTDKLKVDVYSIYYLEDARCSLQINTEHMCLPSLTKAAKLRNFRFVLTGARAKRTKYQQKLHSSLIILAKSSIEDPVDSSVAPDTFELNHEFLLEKPEFQDIGSEPVDEQIVKRVCVEDAFAEDKLLPVAVRTEFIPAELTTLDPNDQPILSAYDNVQLLLRLYTIRQTTPSGNALVDEELSALLSRVLYTTHKPNWTIFSRCLWERSVVETTKAKTIERGLLQMTSLVEELGLKITTRLVPQAADAEGDDAATRLRYIHQLPLHPRWSLDATLAEKYMSMGILKSAVEIYERLHMWCEAALCYASFGDEAKAEEILISRTESNPQDARAWSILGDIRQDPELWEKAWKLGKYVNAKNSLGRYYYGKRDLQQALVHLNDSLTLYPLNFDIWFFYGCIGLESSNMDLAAEAFSRCVSLDDTHSKSWSNLSAALIEQGKLKEAFSALKKATSNDARKSWRIWENYMIVSMKLNEWDDVLLAARNLIDIKGDKGDAAYDALVDLPVVEKLVELLLDSEYNPDKRMTHFQTSCIDFICVKLPTVITTSARAWRIIARVELWRKRPWAALECHERAYRALSTSPEVEINEKWWNETVEACEDLVAAYESWGELPGKYGGGDLVCKDWQYKARQTVKSLMNKGRRSWEDSDGWERLEEVKRQL